jgi:hypothetical protein
VLNSSFNDLFHDEIHRVLLVLSSNRGELTLSPIMEWPKLSDELGAQFSPYCVDSDLISKKLLISQLKRRETLIREFWCLDLSIP